MKVPIYCNGIYTYAFVLNGEGYCAECGKRVKVVW